MVQIGRNQVCLKLPSCRLSAAKVMLLRDKSKQTGCFLLRMVSFDALHEVDRCGVYTP